MVKLNLIVNGLPSFYGAIKQALSPGDAERFARLEQAIQAVGGSSGIAGIFHKWLLSYSKIIVPAVLDYIATNVLHETYRLGSNYFSREVDIMLPEKLGVLREAAKQGAALAGFETTCMDAIPYSGLGVPDVLLYVEAKAV